MYIIFLIFMAKGLSLAFMNDLNSICTDCGQHATKKYNGREYCYDCYEEEIADLCNRNKCGDRKTKDNKTIKFRLNKAK